MNLTVHEIAELLEVTERTVSRWVEREGLPASLVHGVYQIHRAELFDWASTRGMQLPRRFFASKGGIEGAKDFATALQTGGVRRGLTAQDRHAVAEALAGALGIEDRHEHALVTEMIAARPSLGFVATRDGIAVPLAFAPVIGDGPAAIVLALFDSLPSEAQVVGKVAYFVVQAPTVHRHQLLVEDLYAALDDERFRRAALRGDPLAGLVDTITPAPARTDGSPAR